MTDDLEAQINREWKGRLQKNVEGIQSSAIFLGLFSGHLDDATMMMQFGIALFTDKPIYLICPKGQKVPENIKRVARHIEYIKYGDVDETTAAVQRIQKMQEEAEK